MTEELKRYVAGRVYHMAVTEICSDCEQPRKHFDPQALEELKISIQKVGVILPVLVRRSEEDGKFLIVAGERRYRASIAAGKTTVPVLLTNGDPVEISIVENLLREDLTAIEEAEGIDHLKSSHNYQLCDLSGVLGKAESTICEILSLVKLPDSVKEECRKDPKVPRSILAEIAKQRSSAKMQSLYENYKARGLTRGEVRGHKVTLKGAVAEPASQPVEAKPIDIGFVEKFTKHLDKLEIEKLDHTQNQDFQICLDALRLVVNRKLRKLKPLLQTRKC